MYLCQYEGDATIAQAMVAVHFTKQNNAHKLLISVNRVIGIGVVGSCGIYFYFCLVCALRRCKDFFGCCWNRNLLGDLSRLGKLALTNPHVFERSWRKCRERERGISRNAVRYFV